MFKKKKRRKSSNRNTKIRGKCELKITTAMRNSEIKLVKVLRLSEYSTSALAMGTVKRVAFYNLGDFFLMICSFLMLERLVLLLKAPFTLMV
jgi:DNA-binding Xre family transcriptional regulator